MTTTQAPAEKFGIPQTYANGVFATAYDEITTGLKETHGDCAPDQKATAGREFA
jgi:hypothetical protein